MKKVSNRNGIHDGDFKKYFMKMKNKSAKTVGRLKSNLNETYTSVNLKNIFQN